MDSGLHVVYFGYKLMNYSRKLKKNRGLGLLNFN